MERCPCVRPQRASSGTVRRVTSPAVSPTQHSTLANGLRVLALPMSWRQTLSLSVFIRSGSLHEPRRWAGISHVVEHMAFKGTPTRSCQAINLAAEALGAELNAHTDKDHTAYHLDGLAADLPLFVELLADIILHPSVPEDELERERQVILHELTEVEEDPVTMAFLAFDRACYGAMHPAARPVIGQRATIERLTRADLLAYLQTQYVASEVVVAAAGPVDLDTLVPLVERHFGAMPAGTPQPLPRAPWQGGWRQYRLGGSSQTQLVLGYPAPTPDDDRHLAHVLAAALLGEGMSSPLLDEVRERRGLAYHVACSADLLPFGGQFIVEAATSPAQSLEYLDAVATLLRRHAETRPKAPELARARQQLRLRALRQQEQPARRLEQAVQELFTLGRLRADGEWLERLDAVTPAQVQAVFRQQQAGRAAVGVAGSVPQRLREQAAPWFGV
ncbi:insulinase family protein [Ideonella sp. 4Y16]|nr:insulinase family protein [Ideonella alba]